MYPWSLIHSIELYDGKQTILTRNSWWNGQFRRSKGLFFRCWWNIKWYQLRNRRWFRKQKWYNWFMELTFSMGFGHATAGQFIRKHGAALFESTKSSSYFLTGYRFLHDYYQTILMTSLIILPLFSSAKVNTNIPIIALETIDQFNCSSSNCNRTI